MRAAREGVRMMTHGHMHTYHLHENCDECQDLRDEYSKPEYREDYETVMREYEAEREARESDDDLDATE
jgi:hypothetical protein